MVIAAVAIIILWILWAVLARPTKVAFLNYPVIRLGQISRANANSMIELYGLAPEDISGIGRYMVAIRRHVPFTKKRLSIPNVYWPTWLKCSIRSFPAAGI